MRKRKVDAERKLNQLQRKINTLEKTKEKVLQRSIAMENHLDRAIHAAADGKLGAATRHVGYAAALAKSCGARSTTRKRRRKSGRRRRR